MTHEQKLYDDLILHNEDDFEGNAGPSSDPELSGFFCPI